MNRRHVRVVMLYEFNLQHSAAEATRNFTNAVGSESHSGRTVRYSFEKFLFLEILSSRTNLFLIGGCR